MSRATTTCRSTAPSHGSARHAELKQMLDERRRRLEAAVRGRIRDVRADVLDPSHDVRDEAESSQVDSQTDLDFALIELKSETLARVTAALAHLEAGTYGRCMECGGEIAEARLRALPFASRCRDCEDAVERTRERQCNGSRAGLQPSGPGDTPDRTRR